MKKILVSLLLSLICIILLLFIIFFIPKLHTKIKIDNAKGCSLEIFSSSIKSCDKIWGEPGNVCREEYRNKTICGKALRSIYSVNN